MVRLINKGNIKYISDFAYKILRLQEKFTYMRSYNTPSNHNCVYVLWHENQFCIHGLPDRQNVNVLISTSLDGEIVANVCENWGFKVHRGSAGRKGAVSSVLAMLDILKNKESAAIMVDGPRGPYHEVKKGAITLAKDANVPIVPVYWYSEDPTFVHFPSWDKMLCPVGPCRILNLYGDPICADGKSEEQLAQEIKDSLCNLEKIAPQKFKEAVDAGLWKKKL